MAIISQPVRIVVGMVVIQVLAANDQRTRLVIQNLGLTVLKFCFGGFDPTQTEYHFSLSANGVLDNGSSPITIFDLYRGEVRVISSFIGGVLTVMEEFS